MNKEYNIYWNEYSAYTYIYGSSIQYHNNKDVEFENALMPPGQIIKEWHSKTNFQIHRCEPTLPIIDGESSYSINVDIDCDVENGYLVKILYFDKYEDEVGQTIVYKGTTDFKCSLKTYSYVIQLINAGCTKLHFHSITITEKGL